MKIQTQFLVFCLALFLTACGSGEPEQKKEPASTETKTATPAPPTPAAAPPPDIRIETFRNEQNTWGYDLYFNDKRYIHQPHMPAVGGKQGFDTEAQAQRVAELVAEKARQGIMPPSVTAEEVDSLVNMY